MAARYWVGNAGNWNDTAHWTANSDGTGNGASVPTSADDVYFNQYSITSNSQLIQINVAASCASLNFSGLAKTMTFRNSAWAFNIYGSLTLASGLTWNFTGTGYMYFKSTTAQNVTLNGITPTMNKIYWDGVGGKWTINGSANFGSSYHYLTNGEIDTNGQTVTLYWFETLAGTKTLTLRSSTINVTNVWYNNVPAGLTILPGTSTINYIGNDGFYGGAMTYYKLIMDYSGSLRLSRPNTFNELVITAGTTVKFTAGETNTFSKLTAIGTSGSKITIGSYTNAVHYLVLAAGNIEVECDYLSVSYSSVSPTSKFYAGRNSTNAGNNTGWVFGNLVKGSTAIAATETLQAIGRKVYTGSAQIVQGSTVTGEGHKVLTGKSAQSISSIVEAKGLRVLNGKSEINGQAHLDALCAKVLCAAAMMEANGELNANAVRILTGAMVADLQAELLAHANANYTGSAVIECSAMLTASAWSRLYKMFSATVIIEREAQSRVLISRKKEAGVILKYK